jgi:hypothetical protein
MVKNADTTDISEPERILSRRKSPTEPRLWLSLRLEVAVVRAIDTILSLCCGVGGVRLTAELDRAIEAGRLLLVSPFGDGVRRADTRKAERRNRLVVGLAFRVLVIHAAVGGFTERLVRDVIALGKPIESLEALPSDNQD